MQHQTVILSLNFSKESGSLKETIYNHVDYVQSLSVYEREWVATGGRGDKAIYVYETDEKGKLWKRFKFDGHEVREEEILTKKEIPLR